MFLKASRLLILDIVEMSSNSVFVLANETKKQSHESLCSKWTILYHCGDT